MCGLVGLMTSHFAQQDVDKFKDLLLFSSTRGKHSTGVVTISSDIPFSTSSVKNIEADFYYAKAPVNPIEFMEYGEFGNLMNIKNGKVMLGHTRYATKGAINAENAHPFVSRDGTTIGMHNGTLTGTYKYKDDFGTDSEALINILAEDGVEGLKGVSGAWALVWYDWFNNKLRLIRNEERTLFYTKTPAGDILYASEEWMIETVIKKHSKYLKEVPVILSLPPYKLMTLDLNLVEYRKAMTIEAVEGLEAPKVYYGSNSRFHGFHGAYDDWPMFEDREAEEDNIVVPFAYPQQQQQRRPVLLFSAREALKQAVQKRKEAGKESKETTKKGGKEPLENYFSSMPEDDLDVDYEQHFLKGLKERQKVDVDSGHLFIETVPGEFLHEDHFTECAVDKPCFMCGTFKNLWEKREWISREEFICEDCVGVNLQPLTNIIQ